MSRDTQKYWYAQVGIPRTSVLDHLKQEASMRGVPCSTHITDILLDRDAVRYGEEGIGLWIPRGTQIIAPAATIPQPQESDIKSIDEGAMEENLDAFLGFDKDEEA